MLETLFEEPEAREARKGSSWEFPLSATETRARLFDVVEFENATYKEETQMNEELISGLVEENKKLAEELGLLEQDALQQLRCTKQEQEKDAKELRSKTAALEKAIAEQQSKNWDLMREKSAHFREKEREVARFKQRLEKQESMLRETKEKVEAKSQKADSEAVRREQVEKKLQDRAKSETMQRNNLRYLEQQTCSQKKTIKNLRGLLEEKEKSEAKLQSEVSKLQQEVSKLQASVQQWTARGANSEFPFSVGAGGSSCSSSSSGGGELQGVSAPGGGGKKRNSRVVVVPPLTLGGLIKGAETTESRGNSKDSSGAATARAAGSSGAGASGGGGPSGAKTARAHTGGGSTTGTLSSSSAMKGPPIASPRKKRKNPAAAAAAPLGGTPGPDTRAASSSSSKTCAERETGTPCEKSSKPLVPVLSLKNLKFQLDEAEEDDAKDGALNDGCEPRVAYSQTAREADRGDANEVEGKATMTKSMRRRIAAKRRSLGAGDLELKKLDEINATAASSSACTTAAPSSTTSSATVTPSTSLLSLGNKVFDLLGGGGGDAAAPDTARGMQKNVVGVDANEVFLDVNSTPSKESQCGPRASPTTPPLPLLASFGIGDEGDEDTEDVAAGGGGAASRSKSKQVLKNKKRKRNKKGGAASGAGGAAVAAAK
ncbi:unnamed protein product [Amoebophrya sp. A25]|nr:unnamed protein product [Amoebophrya sp. A25]|eukprot:GSA25T00000891001.1